ncbi:MAG TPA: tetratricopeptide repeat protein [Candidatus Acidoferrales bacterium]|nr:tetratricopeptide repeat protein [Candidatus Acidoferrales bacterium]
MANVRHRRFLRFFLSGLLATLSLMRCFPASGQTTTLRAQIAEHEQKLTEARAAKSQEGEASELRSLGSLHRQVGEMQRALECDNQSLAISRALGDRKGEATTLNNIGLVYDALGQKQKALEYYSQAFPIWRELSDRSGEAATLNNIGLVYDALGQKQKALEYYNQVLPIRREVGDRKGEATTLNNIGLVYDGLGQKQKALEYYNQAFPIWGEVGDRSGEASTLNNIGLVYDDLGQEQKALEYYNQALSIRRELGDRSGEATTLNNIGLVYDALGQKQKALEYYNQALPISREVGDRSGEATTLTNIGKVYSDLGQKQKALDYYTQASPIWREVGDRSGEATTLNNIGEVYTDLGQKQKALDYYNQALPILREVEDRSGVASALNNIGGVYDDLGQKQKALDYYNQALVISREVEDRGGEAITLSNIGKVYDDLGQKQKALEYYNQALPIWREVGDRRGEATTLNNIGKVYSDLGQKQKALEYYNQALPIQREVEGRSGEANTLTNIGGAYDDLGQKQKALEYYTQALLIQREVKDRGGESITLNNIGKVYDDLGQKQKALEFYNQALVISREVEDRTGEASTLSNIGLAYDRLGQTQKALSNEMAALSLAKAVADPDLQGVIDALLMKYFRGQQRQEMAIFFGMESVNSFQQIRKNISGLDKELQAGFAKSKSATYRELAELLVQTDHLGEAERVLDLLKEQELKEVVRGAADDAAAKVEPLKLTPAQQKAQTELAIPEKTAEALTGVSLEYGTLLAKEKRTPDEDARLKTLDNSIEQANSEVMAFFTKTLYPELAQKADTVDDANKLLRKEKSDVSQLQSTLAELGPRVMGIRLLFGEEHVYAIVVTAHSRQKFELKATPAELRDKVLQVRDELRTPSSNPKPLLAELYAIVVAPLADELKALEQTPAPAAQNRAPTLLWSLDGVLRYLPMAALYDGQHFMVERFNNVLFTPEGYGHMTAASNSNGTALRVLAMGLSKSYGGLPALPGVLPELEAVVHDPAARGSHGPMEGRLLPDDQFTLAALKAELGAGKSFPVVHIASHFIEETGSGEEPYLMLGGENAGDTKGFELTLSRLEQSTISFHGTQLLTLSACSTAKGDAAKDGQEMDSLGMIAQQKDAGAVLATLWDVADASTSQLMSDFYARWIAHPADGKAESLRQAQLALLHGSAAAKTKDATDYSHPFFWAPFVLMGNFQ